MALEAADEIGGNEGVAAARRLLRDEMAVAGKRHAGGAALVDQRGDAALDTDHVGVEAEAAGDVAIDMGVGVDHPRQHQLAAHVGHLPRRRGQNVLGDRRDLAAGDRHIHHAVDAGGRTDDMAALEDEIVDGGCVHERLPLFNEGASGTSPMPR